MTVWDSRLKERVFSSIKAFCIFIKNNIKNNYFIGNDAAAVKTLEIQADDVIDATPADVNDSSDAVISSSESSVQNSNGGSVAVDTEAGIAAAKSSPQLEDELLREMEEIEGDKESSDETTENHPKERPTVEAEQKTSELLKELENDIGESSDVVAATNHVSESLEVEATHESPNASCVDSTTDPALKTDDSEISAVSPANTDVSPNSLNSETVQLATAMEVDEVAESVVEVPSDKDEAISSTSTDNAQSIPAAEETLDNNCTSAVSKQECIEVKDEDVTSSEDQPDASTNETDSSVVKDVKSTQEVEASHAVSSELNHTLEIEPSTNKAENKVLTNLMMNNGSSTPNSNPVSAAATPNVFNSTPISKQFEISSENVSKIDEHSGAGLTSHNVSTQEDIKTSDLITTYSGKYNKFNYFYIHYLSLSKISFSLLTVFSSMFP